MPKGNDLEGGQDQGGKHGGQKDMPKPQLRPSGAHDGVSCATSVDRSNRVTRNGRSMSAGSTKAATRPAINRKRQASSYLRDDLLRSKG